MKPLNYETKIDPGVVTFRNVNTTLGFVRFNEQAEIEYIFVQQPYRRQGLASKLLQTVEQITGQQPKPQPPVSPLGRKLFGVQLDAESVVESHG